MEYVTVNRAAYNWKPAEQEQARQDLITFIVNEIFDGNTKMQSDTKSFSKNLHNDEVPSYLSSLKVNCSTVKAELAEKTESGYLKNVFMQVRYVFYLANRSIDWLSDA